MLTRRRTGLWNFIIGYITPYMLDEDKGNLKTKVFFLWGATCTACVVFAFFFVPETKGLSLEQVDCMLEETTPRSSTKWVPHSTYADHDKKDAAPEAMFQENRDV